MHAILFLAAAAAVAADAKDDAAKNELKKFQGTWVMVSGEKEGEKLRDEQVRPSKITWKGGEVTLFTPHQSDQPIRAHTTVRPDKSPKQMEWVREAGPGKGQKMHAIYEFLGDDQYRICFGLPGKERPTEFHTKPGSGHLLHVWKKAKE